MTKFVISVDPGIEKSGLLLADLEKNIVLDGKVVMKNMVLKRINFWRSNYRLDQVFIGNGTSSSYWIDSLKEIAPIKILEERDSTLKARLRYWEIWPPNYLLRILPRNILLPPKDIDAVAALVILENHLNRKLNWTGKPNFKIEL